MSLLPNPKPYNLNPKPKPETLNLNPKPCVMNRGYCQYEYRIQDTEWCRPIGCLKLQVIFCKRATKYRALWQKMTYQDQVSYGSSPPSNEDAEDALSFEVIFRKRAL